MYCYFFKFFLLFLICISGYHIKAQQRICDLEAVCISPADTVVNGKALPLRFGRKNLGPDILFQNDTTYYLLYRVVEGQKKIDYSGAFGSSGKGDTVNIGNSTIYRDNYEISFNYPDLKEPLVLEYCVQIDSWKRNAWGDTIGFSYYDTNAENNTCCKQVVVMPEKITAIADLANRYNTFMVYPNPADKMLYLRIENQPGMGDVEVILRDVAGKKLLIKGYRERDIRAGILPLSIAHFPAGIYTVSLQTTTAVSTRKIMVGR